jgi:hypothetical protein
MAKQLRSSWGLGRRKDACVSHSIRLQLGYITNVCDSKPNKRLSASESILVDGHDSPTSLVFLVHII